MDAKDKPESDNEKNSPNNLVGIPNFYQEPFKSAPDGDPAVHTSQIIDLDTNCYSFNDQEKARKRIGAIIKILSRLAFYENSYNLLVEYKLAREALEDLENFIEPVNEQALEIESARKKQLSRYELIEKAIKALEEKNRYTGNDDTIPKK
ncbi:MAG: hypothetical protein JXA13_17645 [Anaerolineales bacterium]|nr:hypothetical protein [Anaerolineales bacterium]